MTIGSGRGRLGWSVVALRSNRSTSEVVGGIGESSVGSSSLSVFPACWNSDNRLGLGGAAGLLVVDAVDSVLGACAAAREAAWKEGDFVCSLWVCGGTPRLDADDVPIDAASLPVGLCILRILSPVFCCCSRPVTGLPGIGRGEGLPTPSVFAAAKAPFVPLYVLFAGFGTLGSGRPKAVVAPSRAALR
jgi:hypothetical protein